jgi:hypothetical protein
MTVLVYSVFVLSCVGSGLGDRADHPFKESYRLTIRSTVPDLFWWETGQYSRIVDLF